MNSNSITKSTNVLYYFGFSIKLRLKVTVTIKINVARLTLLKLDEPRTDVS